MTDRRPVALILAFAIAVCLVPTPARADDDQSDAALLTKHLGSSDPDRTVAYLNAIVMTDAKKAELKKLIDQMGDPAFKLRQEASKKIAAFGPSALPLLQQALASSNREIASRAKRCIDDIESAAGADLVPAAIRHLAQSKHPKAVDLFLTIYPAITKEPVQREILHGLSVLGVTEKTVHPSIVKALDDADPMRRSLAVQVLLTSTEKDVRKPVKAKLKDRDANVCYYAAIGLAESDRDAIPALIGLIKDSPNPMHWQHAEECLYAAAGEQARGIEVGEGKAEDRKRIAESWQNWWDTFGGQFLPGQKEVHPTDSVVLTDTNTKRVWEWRPDGKPRFDIKGSFSSPVDARILPGNRLLVADEPGRKVTERDFKTGNVIWERTFEQGPVSVQRLPNGNTFVALYDQMVEVRRDGEIVSTISIGLQGRISDANKLPDGRIGCLAYDNKLFLLSPEGKLLKEVETESYGGVEAMANGNILVSQVDTGKILEIDKNGTTVWQVQIPGAHVGSRQPDGTTLVASKTLQKMYKVDKDGKTLWEKPIDGIPHAMHWK
jgi:hypothetical protein